MRCLLTVGRSARGLSINIQMINHSGSSAYGRSIEDGQKGYGLVNLYSTLSFDDDRYQVRAFVRNATNEEYKYWTLYALSTGWSGSFAPPRTWGIDLTMNF